MNLIWLRNWNNLHNKIVNLNTCQAVFTFKGGKISFSFLSVSDDWGGGDGGDKHLNVW